MKRLLHKYGDFLRYLVCGGTATGIDFVLYMLLSARMDISVAKLCSMCTASLFSFVVNKYWTFEDRHAVTGLQVAKYVSTQVVNVGVNVGINRLVYILSGSKFLAFVIATGIAMIVNYLLQKIIVFRKGNAQ